MVFLTYGRFINRRFHLFRSPASSFSCQYLFCFSNHQKVEFFLFLLLSLLSSVFHGIMKKGISSLNMTNQWTYGRYVVLTYGPFINCRFHLFQSSASSFSCQYLFCFSNKKKCVLPLPSPFTSVICISRHHEEGIFFLRI